ncbi:alanine--tRNA ligase [Candidatus Pacearchaeota archaeon]|nr:alanine--tRNA ligase [Candidatus Pacearchaeota archaeon]
MIKTRQELIHAYIEFFKSKGHKEIPNTPLIPENDPTVLFTTAGMHPLVPFILGQKHPQGKRLVNAQKCIRTGDIEEVGDEQHLTFFEMLGNWSLGDYWKKEAVEFSLEFLEKKLGIKKEELRITCFKGDKEVKRDIEAAEAWKSLGLKDSQIVFLGREDNWWGPAGKTGPCGPDTEMFIKQDGEWIEIWNDVFMQYNKDENNNYKELKQKNVDTGMGVERTIAILTGKEVFQTDSFVEIINKIEEISGKAYEEHKRDMRIIADHIKASVFILNEKLVPANVERGYVLRRLIRRAIRYGNSLKIETNFTRQVAESVFSAYKDYKFDKKFILSELEKEETKFRQTLAKGINLFERMIKGKKKLTGEESFLLYQSYGFPIELTKELANERKIHVDIEEFNKEFEKHQELSRTASAGKFKSGLADKSEETTKLHTATHLLNQALREVLGKQIIQKGSNITAERLRFDFNFDRKLSEEEIKKIEGLVNKKIKEKLKVECNEMTVEEAKKTGAHGVFEHKYGEKVSVYTIGNFSKEICAGPHVKNTSELGKFKILEQENIGAGTRRIKAVLE